ncbi:MAG: SCP2 sterol-binding domain-containing protein [Myxococcales bacterium]|nr:SCP2 sterol-binding domain-containing protein [Myxococcales bacterium]
MTKRPPRDMVPSAFFEEWLPGVFAAEFSGGRRAAPEIRVRVRLQGEAGGAWDLAISGGVLRVGQESAEGGEPLVTVTQTVEDWRAVAVGEEGAVDLAPPQASALDMLFVDSSSRQMLQAVRGTIRFEVTGYNGRTWAMTVKFGDQPQPPEPNATISIDAETYAKLRARQMQPPEAYFSGKIKMIGDTGLAMQLGMAMMPRFSQ